MTLLAAVIVAWGVGIVVAVAGILRDERRRVRPRLVYRRRDAELIAPNLERAP